MNKNVLAIAYFIFLCYLFIGISIIAEIFMDAIEVITSTTRVVATQDADGNDVYLDIPIWNPTVANLTLMALGSSAPEILLSVIETLQTLGQPAGELGSSTIVGSAAFNLLVISGVSIIAVSELKKIDDLGVFFTTSVFSLFAYIWLYICLQDDEIDIVEAWLTFVFFFLLVILAFLADKFNQRISSVKVSAEQLQIKQQEEEQKIRKAKLRRYVYTYGEMSVLQAGKGTPGQTSITEDEQADIVTLFQQLMKVETLKDASINDMATYLEPDSLLERFAAKKANKIASQKDFVLLKGGPQQVEKEFSLHKAVKLNENIGFKCIHYSVVESCGQAVVTIVKKSTKEISFGVRTVDGSALKGKDYESIEEVYTNFNKEEITVSVPIMNDAEWEPDSDFQLELFDLETRNKLEGDDTTCTITILDEDFPGTLGFEATDIHVDKKMKKATITINRRDGSDGKISCYVKTEPLSDKQNARINANEYDDYMPFEKIIEFESGETLKMVEVELVNDNEANLDTKAKTTIIDANDSEEGEVQDKMFKVTLSRAEPAAVKISKKNVCIVHINKKEDEDVNEEHEKMMEYFMATREANWGQQFKNAVLLGPSIDEDNLIVDHVTLYEGLSHFASMFWKVLFALVPPAQMGNGVPAFFIALTFIGIITAIVGEVATILGCVIGLQNSVTAITLVAMGTSLPDTFASMTAARQSQYADSAVGNITGSNSVNVFLGLGLPWVIAAHYNNSNGDKYVVPSGSLGFTVFLFLCCSVACFIILIIRRMVS